MLMDTVEGFDCLSKTCIQAPKCAIAWFAQGMHCIKRCGNLRVSGKRKIQLTACKAGRYRRGSASQGMKAISILPNRLTPSTPSGLYPLHTSLDGVAYTFTWNFPERTVHLKYQTVAYTWCKRPTYSSKMEYRYKASIRCTISNLAILFACTLL